MNIFFTNSCPFICAAEHNHVHQVKMILEGIQLLSAAHHIISGEKAPAGIYKLTHKNHPSAIWVRQSSQHYEWLWLQVKELCSLYTSRTGKTHKSESVLDLIDTPPVGLSDCGFSNPPVAAPDEFKTIGLTLGVEVAYQKYLNSKFKEWLSRERPMKVEFTTKPDWCVV